MNKLKIAILFSLGFFVKNVIAADVVVFNLCKSETKVKCYADGVNISGAPVASGDYFIKKELIPGSHKIAFTNGTRYRLRGLLAKGVHYSGNVFSINEKDGDFLVIILDSSVQSGRTSLITEKQTGIKGIEFLKETRELKGKNSVKVKSRIIKAIKIQASAFCTKEITNIIKGVREISTAQKNCDIIKKHETDFGNYKKRQEEALNKKYEEKIKDLDKKKNEIKKGQEPGFLNSFKTNLSVIGLYCEKAYNYAGFSKFVNRSEFSEDRFIQSNYTKESQGKVRSMLKALEQEKEVIKKNLQAVASKLMKCLSKIQPLFELVVKSLGDLVENENSNLNDSILIESDGKEVVEYKKPVTIELKQDVILKKDRHKEKLQKLAEKLNKSWGKEDEPVIKPAVKKEEKKDEKKTETIEIVSDDEEEGEYSEIAPDDDGLIITPAKNNNKKLSDGNSRPFLNAIKNREFKLRKVNLNQNQDGKKSVKKDQKSILNDEFKQNKFKLNKVGFDHLKKKNTKKLNSKKTGGNENGLMLLMKQKLIKRKESMDGCDSDDEDSDDESSWGNAKKFDNSKKKDDTKKN